MTKNSQTPDLTITHENTDIFATILSSIITPSEISKFLVSFRHYILKLLQRLAGVPMFMPSQQLD